MVSITQHVLHWDAAKDAIYNALNSYLPRIIELWLQWGEAHAHNGLVSVIPGKFQLVSILLLLFTANGIFEPLEVALNKVWGCKVNRSFVRNQALSLALIFGCGTLAMLSAMFTGMYSVWNGIFPAPVASFLTAALVEVVALPVSMLVLFLIYWLLPNCKVRPVTSSRQPSSSAFCSKCSSGSTRFRGSGCNKRCGESTGPSSIPSPLFSGASSPPCSFSPAPNGPPARRGSAPTDVHRGDLDNRGLAELPVEIGELIDVQTLSAWRNHLTSLPDWLWQLTELRFLNLGENQIREISNDIARLVNLHTLDLGHNALTSLPESMGDLPNLTRYLYLSNNRLSTVPGSLGRLVRLGYLNISHNRITSLPDSFGNLDGLRELRLYNNELTGVPESFGHLTHLRELHLRDNRITHLPAELGGLESLRILDLRNNALSHLPSSFARLTRLAYLDLRANRFARVPEFLVDLPQLEKLDLRWNNLECPPTWVDDLEKRGCTVLL
jgi:hypothetical protein